MPGTQQGGPQLLVEEGGREAAAATQHFLEGSGRWQGTRKEGSAIYFDERKEIPRYLFIIYARYF